MDKRKRAASIWVPVVGLGLLALAGIAGPMFLDPLALVPQDALQPPSTQYPFGTDPVGFDILSRTIASIRVDLPLALIGIVFSLLVGVPLGLVASSKGRLGEWLMRGLDGFQAFPLLLLAVAVVALMGNRIENVVLAIAIINVPRFMRLVRSEVLSLREARFVEAATAFGASPGRIMFRHLLPNVWGVILVQSSLGAAQAIIVISALSFIGIGISPPQASWGSMVRVGASNMATGEWWVALFPASAIFVTVLLLNGLADRLAHSLRRTRS